RAEAPGRFDRHALLAGDVDGAAASRRRVGFHDAGDHRLAGFRFDLDRARRRSARSRYAARVERDVLDRLEHDLAVLADDCRVRVGRTALADEPGIHANAPAGGDELAQVDRLILGRTDLHAHFRRLRVHELDRPARGEQNLALGRPDDALVLYAAPDE